MRPNILIKQAPKCYSVKEVVLENNVKDLLRNLRNTFRGMKPSIKTSWKSFAKFLPLSLLLGRLFPFSSIFTIGCWQPANLRTASQDLQQDMYLEGIALRLEPCVT